MPSIRPHGFWPIFLATLILPLLAKMAAASSADVVPSATSTPSKRIGSVTLRGSIRPVPNAPANRPVDPRKPLITRSTLAASETDAPLNFEVALRMRNFAELQARVLHGERIPAAEMAARYAPLPADYQAVIDWLKGAGFTITRQDVGRIAVFARGPISKIAGALNVQFARVSFKGRDYTSAISAPSVPASLAPVLLGVNGLQPHIQMQKHIVQQQPLANETVGGSTPYYPGQLATAYNATGLYASNVTGAGQSIAIVIDTFPLQSDLETFWQNTGINQTFNNIVFQQVIPGGTYPSPTGEETLDVEWASSMAPGAMVRVYATTDLEETNLDAAYAEIYSDVTTNPSLGINQMSMSFGLGETYSASSQVQTDDQFFAELTAAGVTVFASSGDGGSSPGLNSSTDETGPVQVETPASDPNVTGVGGTSLSLNSDNTVNNEVAWGNFSGGGGGGVSIYFARPYWQNGSGVSGAMREVPDISAAADPSLGAYLYLNGSAIQVGGTSWSSPTCAGLCALLNQVRAKSGQSSLGHLAPWIYPLIGTPNFRDITSGSNATSLSGGLYAATVGYDPASGIGAPLLGALAQSLIVLPSLPSIQPAFQTIVPNQNATVTVTAAATPVSYQWQVMPIGSTSWSNLSDGSSYSGSATTTLSISGVTSAVSGNQYQCVVTYSGNITATSGPSALVVDSPLVISTLAGQAGTAGLVNATGTAAEFSAPSGVTLDPSGNIYVADFTNNVIREVTPGGVVTTPYGSASGHASNKDATGNNARFNEPNSVAADNVNNLLYVADTNNNSIRKITLSTQAVTTFATTVNPSTTLNQPNGVAVDSSGNVYVADTNNEVIEKITPAGVLSVIAGTVGTAGYINGDGPTQALFNTPLSLAVDPSGNIYVADFGNNVVRKITPAGAVSTYAGQAGIAAHADGLALQAIFNAPTGVAVDNSGNVYVTDSLVPGPGSTAAGNDLIRRITPSGVVSTIAGQAGVAGSNDGTGSAAQFFSVQAAAFNPSTGEIYLADTYNNTIRQGGIDPVVTTQLGSQTVTAGQAVTFSVTATGTGSLTYQWYMNGNLISGATSAAYTIPTTATGSAGTYTVIVTDPFGSTTSSSFTLTVNQPVPALPLWGWFLLPLLILRLIGRYLPRNVAVP